MSRVTAAAACNAQGRSAFLFRTVLQIYHTCNIARVSRAWFHVTRHLSTPSPEFSPNTIIMNSTPRKTLQGLDSLSLISEAQSIISHVKSWKKGGVYRSSVPQVNKEVATRTYSTNLNNDHWVARYNDFEELSVSARLTLFRHLMKYSVGSTSDLQESHTEYEKGYIVELVDFNLSPFDLENSPTDYECFTYLAELNYNLGWPLKKRKFANLVLIAKAKDGQRGYVISLAIDPSLVPNLTPGPDYVNAQYTSVEEVMFDEDLGALDWTMATASDAKGNIPHWLANANINKVVAKDVPHFLNWVSKKD